MTSNFNDFSESEMSDDNEEYEDSSEEDFEEHDDHRVGGPCVQQTNQPNYENNWNRQPAIIKEDFRYEPRLAPARNFESEETVFYSIISPGILNM